MSSTNPLSTWSNSKDTRDSTINRTNNNSTRSRTVSSPNYNNWHVSSVNERTSSDSDVSNLIPSYVDILSTTNSGQDWLESYEFPVLQKKENSSHRRTFQQPGSTTSANQSTITVRKTKSMRDQPTTANTNTNNNHNNINYNNHSRSKLRSPPPPPPSIQDEIPLNELIQQQQKQLSCIPSDKKQSLPFINKVKRKLSFSKEKPTPPVEATLRTSLPPPSKPRRTVSSGILSHEQQQQQQQQFTSNSLAEYQGYSRHSRHRSFTYSPPPPPRTSSLKASSVEPSSIIPPVPPVPKQHAAISTHTKSRTITKKKSDSLSYHSESSSNGSNCSRSNSGNNKSRVDSLPKVTQPVVTNIKSIPTPTPSSVNNEVVPEYNLSKDLAQIEEDIKALEIQRQSFILATNQSRFAEAATPKTIGRKRGKTLPGSLATPPPIPVLPLPPMQLNPIQMTIPTIPKKAPPPPQQRVLPPLQKSISTTPTTTRIKLTSLNTIDDDLFSKQRRKERQPGLGLGSGITGFALNKPIRSSNKSSPPIVLKKSVSSTAIAPKRKSHVPPSTKTNLTVRRAASYRQPTSSPPMVDDSVGRSPKSVYTALKYYGQYLSEYERQVEIHDYNHIFFVGPHATTKYGNLLDPLNFGFDDERGDYKIVMQDHLAYRYEVIDLLGRGSFGQVVKCFDHKTATMVAIKLIRNKKRFHAQAITEVNILKKLVEWDPEDKHNTIQMTDHFYFRNHLCIAFECLSMNLYEFIKNNHFQGFSLSLIKRITYQILQSLTLLAEHNVIHCDLKPENIMLCHPAKNSIKVIDFGSSCFESERVYTYIQSRFYRSPEVILGLSYHKAIDMWSVGCIAAELYTGLPLFPGENEQEQLGCIMETMGLPDRHLIERCSRRKLFFDSTGHPRIVANSKGKKRLPRTKSLYQALKCHDIVFIDFIERCLQWDPAKRLTPREALQHEFITNNSISPPKPIQSYLSTAAALHNNNIYNIPHIT